nr:tetratricopeptide repeat protein [Desulfobacula sp.]
MRKIAFQILVSVLTALLFSRPGISQEDWYEKGLFFNRTGQYDKAVEAFSKAIEADPGNAKAYNNRGAVRYIQGRYDDAVKDYTRALDLSPDSASFYINRAAARFKTGDYDKTLADYDRALQLDPASADAFNNRGMARYFTGDYDRAVADHTRAIELNPDTPEFYNNRGAAWFRKERPERAIMDYSLALGLNPKSANALRNRGIAWFQKEFYDRAIADYTRALEMDSTSAELYVSRGLAFYQTGDYGKAVNDFVDAVTLEPENPGALNQLAWMLSVCPDSRYRNGAKALEMAQKAETLSPGPNTLDTLAAAFAESGDYQKAAEFQETLIAQFRETGGDIPEEYTAKLEFYRAGKPWRAATLHPLQHNGAYPAQQSVRANPGNIRSAPSTDALVIDRVRQGQALTLLGKDQDWFLVELAESRLGWGHESIFASPGSGPDQTAPPPLPVDTAAAAPEEPPASKAPAVPEPPAPAKASTAADEEQTVEVRVEVARIRSLPEVNAPVLYKVIKGDRLAVLEETPYWYRVSLGKDKTGWGHKTLFLP